MALEDDVLTCAIELWNERFTGASSETIAHRLNISHQLVWSTLCRLAKVGKGSLRVIADDKSGIFFPARDVLSEWYYNNINPREQIPEYHKRLHLGYSQIQHFYFDVAVLSKYLARPDRYKVDDSVEGGSIRMQAAFWEQALDSNDDVHGIGNMRFGKRLLASGETAIGAILWDLADLPPEEQRYWHSFEIECPQFQSTDPAFKRYVMQNFDAVIVESQDPLFGLLHCLAEVNEVSVSLTGIPLYRHVSNPYLHPPIHNTYKAFCDSCSELYKLLGPDSINQNAIKSILHNKFGFTEENFIHAESRRPLSTLQFLDALLTRLPHSRALGPALRQLQQYRIDADHKIDPLDRNASDYLARFLTLCDHLMHNMRAFRDELQKLSA